MRRPLPLTLNGKERAQLESWSRGGSTPYRLVIRSRIVLLASLGYTNRAIARRLNTNPITVARWRSRFALMGVEGIRREAPRSGSPPPLPEDVVRAIVEKTLHQPPGGRTHWSTRSLARATGVSHSTVRRIWKRHGIRPNQSRVAQLAQQSRHQSREADLVGVYVNPPRKAAAIWFGEEPSKRPGGTPSDRRTAVPASATGPGNRWMTDLVATLNLLDRREAPRTSRRYMDQEFLSFLRSVQERGKGTAKVILLGGESGPSLSPGLVRWLSRHPQLSTETCAATEGWTQKVVESIRRATGDTTRRAPLDGVSSFLSAVDEWSRESDRRPRPFVWTRFRASSEVERAGDSRPE